MANDDTPRDHTDLELEIMLDIEFIRSNPSPEVMRQYAMDRMRQAMIRDARKLRDIPLDE